MRIYIYIYNFLHLSSQTMTFFNGIDSAFLLKWRHNRNEKQNDIFLNRFTSFLFFMQGLNIEPFNPFFVIKKSQIFSEIMLMGIL